MGASAVQHCGGGTATTESSCTLPNVAVGDLIVAACTNHSTSSTLTSVSDGKNVYTLTPHSPTLGRAWIAYAANVKGGNTTVSCSLPNEYQTSIRVVEFSGVNTLDTDGYSAVASGGDIVDTPSVTPGHPGDALFAVALSEGRIDGAEANWSLCSVTFEGACAYQILSDASATPVAFKQRGASGWTALEAAFTNVVFATAPPQAASAGYKTLAFDDEFGSLSLAPSSISSANYNWYPGIWWENPGPASSLITDSSSVLTLDWNRSSSHSTGLEDTSISSESGNGSAGQTFRYGYFEASMKWDNVTGSWPAFWMLPIQGIQGAANTGEIDIFEGQGGSNAYYGTLLTWKNSVPTWASSPNTFSLPANNDFTQFHTYGLLWTPGEVTWYYDNNPVGSASTTALFDQQDFYLVLGSQEGANWTAGNLRGVAATNINLYVDWVHVWK